MPPRKRAAEASGSESKKPRVSAADEPNAELDPTAVRENAEGEEYVEIGKTRRVTVREFKGKTLIDVRDFYKDKTSGELKPTSKGIALTPEQWAAVKQAMGAVDQMVVDLENKK